MRRRASKAAHLLAMAAAFTGALYVPGDTGLAVAEAQSTPAGRQPAARTATDPSAVLKAALAALGPDLRSIRFAGFGSSYLLGQNPAPNAPWPRLTLKKFDVSIDYTSDAMLFEILREGPAIQPRGGGQPFTGEQRQTQAVSGALAWNVLPPPPPARGTPPPAPPAGAAAGPGREAAAPLVEPAPAAAAERRAQIALTPHGFLKAALAGQTVLQPVAGGTQVTFTSGGRRFEGLLNGRNQLERARTWIDNPVFGDMMVETTFTGYEKFGLITFPTRLLQRQGGHPALDMFVATVTANEATTIVVPESVRAAAPAAPRVDVQTLGDGIHYLRGGSHHSVAIEMADHIVLVEAPLDEARSIAILAALKGLAPSKPVRTVINTHHHFDHSGGLRRMADEGATIVTQAMNATFYEAAWAAPRTLGPDALAKSGRKPAFTGFADRHVIGEGRRSIEVHRLAGSMHHDGMAVIYLPAEKLLIEADVFTPPDAVPAPAGAAREGAAGPAPAAPTPPLNPVALNLYENILRLKLDVATVVPLHGSRTAPVDELSRAAGR